MKSKLRQLATAAMVSAAFNSAPAAILYVDLNSANPTPPFTNWVTAATTIQDAVDAASGGDQILVTNGVYQTGGRQIGFDSANRVTVDKPLTLRSVNGPQSTLINGGFGTRCVYLANGSFLAGFTLTNGNLTAQSSGGGVLFGDSPSDAVVSNCWVTTCAGIVGGGGAPASEVSGPPGSGGGTFINCTFDRNVATGISAGIPFPPTLGGAVTGCRLIHCTLTGNSAGGPASAAGGGAYASNLQNCILTSNSVVRGSGGGAAESILVNCLLIGNSSDASGGGVSYSSLSNCTLTANAATNEAGGALGGTLNNCIVYGNFASSNANYTSGSALNFSCTTPMPTNGTGNITNAPLFVNVGAADFRLQSDSPCINAGNNDYVTSPEDLAGWERIVDDTVDMGAYEWIATPTHYVSLTCPNPTAPYLSWSTAATNIQDAIDASWTDFPHRVLVTNGVYQTGGRAVGSYGWRNRVVVPSGMWVESVNGPQVTVIQGSSPSAGLMRCVYIGGPSSRLSGFTLTNGSAEKTIYIVTGDSSANYGGGVYCAPFFLPTPFCPIAF